MFFATPAFAQTAGAAAAGGGLPDQLVSLAPILLMVVVGYFLLFRPQQQRMKAHREKVQGVKRGDSVVLASGVVGKVTRVDEHELQVEVAPNMNVKVVRHMIHEVRARGEPAAANDTKS